LTPRVRTRSRPPGRLPTCHELASAPQLAILTSIEAAIDVAIVAIVAAQPELWPSATARDVITTPAAEQADHVIRSAQVLAAAIADYRAALRDHRNDLLA
jgi:hypothetical protein